MFYSGFEGIILKSDAIHYKLTDSSIVHLGFLARCIRHFLQMFEVWLPIVLIICLSNEFFFHSYGTITMYRYNFAMTVPFLRYTFITAYYSSV